MENQNELLWCCKCDEDYPEYLVHLCDDPDVWSKYCSGYYHCYACGECVGECKYLFNTIYCSITHVQTTMVNIVSYDMRMNEI